MTPEDFDREFDRRSREVGRDIAAGFFVTLVVIAVAAWMTR